MYQYGSPLGVLCVLLCACTPQIRMLKEPIADQVADYRWVATAPDGVSVMVHTVLVRNSPGSWERDADWDEYILAVKNSSPSAVQVKNVQLYSAYLPFAQQSSLSRQQLENKSHETLTNVRDVTLVAGSGAVVVGTTVAVASAGVIAGVAAIPVGFIGLDLVGSQVQRASLRRNREQQDRSLIELTILERGIHLPLVIPADTEATRSAFFPLTPAPSRLVIAYRINDDHRVLVLELPALAQLHIKSGTMPR
jgi:hypothetical protein